MGHVFENRKKIPERHMKLVAVSENPFHKTEQPLIEIGKIARRLKTLHESKMTLSTEGGKLSKKEAKTEA
jgi:hypothetical protein